MRPLRTKADERHYPIAQIFSSVAASIAPAPLIRSCLSRALAPATRLTSRTATPRLLAMSFISAALASPSRAAARTRTFSTLRPSASCATPSMASRPPRGVSRTTTTTPSTAEQSSSSEHVGEDIERDAVANENDDQDQDHRRNIDAAEIGHEVADRPQRRLGDAKEKIADHADDRVADVHHVERDQPGEDCGGD